jgi:hypothetical protein
MSVTIVARGDFHYAHEREQPCFLGAQAVLVPEEQPECHANLAPENWQRSQVSHNVSAVAQGQCHEPLLPAASCATATKASRRLQNCLPGAPYHRSVPFCPDPATRAAQSEVAARQHSHLVIMTAAIAVEDQLLALAGAHAGEALALTLCTLKPPDVVRQLYREWSTTLEEGEWERRNGAE